jgi:hypothetical protein
MSERALCRSTQAPAAAQLALSIRCPHFRVEGGRKSCRTSTPDADCDKSKEPAEQRSTGSFV